MTEHVDSFKDVFQKLWKECTQEQQVNFAMTAKILWRRRNTKLWENKNELVEDVISQASNVFHTSKRAEQSVTYSNNKCIVHYTTWQPSPTSFIKCNLDAALSSMKYKAEMEVVHKRWQMTVYDIYDSKRKREAFDGKSICLEFTTLGLHYVWWLHYY
jgi:hypothetical protein